MWPGFGSSFGTQRWLCDLRLSLPGCGSFASTGRLEVGANWGGIEGYKVLLYLMLLKGKLFHLGFLKAGNQ